MAPAQPLRRRQRLRQLRRRRPMEVASADRAWHRLPRGGDRQLNFALHQIAVTQIRIRASRGRAYYDTKIAAGRTHNEAMRRLKRRLAGHVWRIMTADERHLHACRASWLIGMLSVAVTGFAGRSCRTRRCFRPRPLSALGRGVRGPAAGA
jgi:Transposase IS116/IS110/IS902 family